MFLILEELVFKDSPGFPYIYSVSRMSAGIIFEFRSLSEESLKSLKRVVFGLKRQ